VLAGTLLKLSLAVICFTHFVHLYKEDLLLSTQAPLLSSLEVAGQHVAAQLPKLDCTDSPEGGDTVCEEAPHSSLNLVEVGTKNSKEIL
jgi:hypothetical protein